MSHNQPNSDVQRLLGEKEHLKKQEEVLRLMIEKVKKQVNAIQVEQLQISSRLPLARISPVNQDLDLDSILQSKPEQSIAETGWSTHIFTKQIILIFPGPAIPEINLDILGALPSAQFGVDQGETEEEEEEEEEK